MNEYEATFDVASKTDAYAVERALDRLYDTLREESRTVREGTSDSTEMLEQFAAVRDAVRDPTPGTLTVRYEQHGESFTE
jgi:hypothetical protein